MSKKRKIISAISVFLIVVIGIAGYKVYKEISIAKQIARMNISPSKIVYNRGYEEIDTRYVTIGKEKYTLTREFKEPEKAMKQFKERYPDLIKKLRKYKGVIGDLSSWNWESYQIATRNLESELTVKEWLAALYFFGIYENTSENKDLLRSLTK